MRILFCLSSVVLPELWQGPKWQLGDRRDRHDGYTCSACDQGQRVLHGVLHGVLQGMVTGWDNALGKLRERKEVLQAALRCCYSILLQCKSSKESVCLNFPQIWLRLVMNQNDGENSIPTMQIGVFSIWLVHPHVSLTYSSRPPHFLPS